MTQKRSSGHPFLIFALCLCGALFVFFHQSFEPDKVFFSNDGPLGAMNQTAIQLPAGYTGEWYDLNSIGNSGGTAMPNFSQAVLWLLGPLGWAKFFPLVVLLFLGFSAWFFFRQLKLSPTACFIGGFAVTLNSGFFSTTCWGVGQQILAAGWSFLAMAAIVSRPPRWPWTRFILAGLATGMVVMEGADVGALISFFIAAFGVFWGLTSDGPIAKRLARGLGGVALVTIFAFFMAAQMISVQLKTAIIGVSGTRQDTQSKQERWDFATQWSSPKIECLSLMIPGIFGFGLNTPAPDMAAFREWFEGGNYWGRCGRSSEWDHYFADKDGPLRPGHVLRINFPKAPNLNSVQQIRGDGKISLPSVGDLNVGGRTAVDIEQEILKRYPASVTDGVSVGLVQPPGFLRHTGGGGYAGVLTVLMAIWAGLQALRKKDSVFTHTERKVLWFCLAVGGVALLLAFGRYAPFYRLVYRLPYFSTIRNPSKFGFLFGLSFQLMFAYGIHGLARRYMEAGAANGAGLMARLKIWWAKVTGFDRRWVIGCGLVLAVSLLGWLVYAKSRPSLEQYLQEVQFSPDMAHAIAAFSIKQVGWFILFFMLSAGLVILILSGAFAGVRSRWGGILLGTVLVLDLGLANQPWLIFWNYKQKYASNPVLEMLRERPYEHRVAILPFQFPPQLTLLSQLHGLEWSQHLFLYNNIQSLDIVQMPRMPEDLMAYETALHFNGATNTLHHVTRRWALTNTRYLLGPAGYLEGLNQQFDPQKRRFRIAMAFDIVGKPGITNPTRLEELTAVTNAAGQYAVFEFTGAMPRAKLYPAWEVSTNDQATLERLTSPDFDPEKTVLVANPVPSPRPAGATNQNSGTVKYDSYAPARIVLSTADDSPSLLLLNDKFDPDWKVTVDGKPEPLLRCNFIMRGVALSAGPHVVEFRFQPPIKLMFVSLAAIGVGLLLLLLLFVGGPGDAQEPTKSGKK